ncbi:TWiK family of potassium channels protein 18-like [Anoplophora glabripennis]|uniref:TWiK family of potassium channels protein 18-like n=1 Tax=Anoplophora glabripennis TaxID=217634 RepID=UPI000874F0B7|nr:TWiK family of potassium channels protein 18-like [Anoplophora glabripennis]
MASDNSSIKSWTSKSKTPSDGGKKVGFRRARPTLIIPPPQLRTTPSPYTAKVSYTAGRPTSDVYDRKGSVFVFDQINGIKNFTVNTDKSGTGIGEKCSYRVYHKIKSWSKKWFTHFFLTIIMIIYTVGGAVIFITIEGQNELKVIDTINKEMDRLLAELREDSIRIPNEESVHRWEGIAVQKLKDFDIMLIEAYNKDPLIVGNTGDKIWSMWNAVVYCATVYTTIGYGHLYPTTITGRALTIVYAIIGIPLFLIALTDFGKLFTRAIKFVWSFVRRLYYTGSCRKARKKAHVKDIFKGAQLVYDIATFRRPSVFSDDSENPQPAVTPIGSVGISANEETPTTPALSNYEINDEFNLPISLALFILISYIFIGAVVYWAWEGWDFFASFYFVFISMSTVGFGDFVPKKVLCMLVSIFYLVFGLALMSMCINVVQEKLSDTFKQASAKLRATIGIQGEDDTSIVAPEIVEMPDIHDPSAIIISENNNVSENLAPLAEKES